MGKRASTKVAAPKAEVVAKKAKVTATVDPAFTCVSDAVMEAEQLPDRVRTMLVEMMPFSLKFASDERHDLQSMAVNMVEQTLATKKSTLEAAVVAATGELASLKASESQLGTAVTNAESALASQREVVEAQKTALAGFHFSTTKASATHLDEKRTDQKSAADNLVTMEKERASIEAAFSEHFGSLQEGEAKAALKKLEPFLKKIEIESTLLTALPSCCAKKNENRGTFDHLVLQELDKSFKAKIAALGDSVAAAGPAAVQHDAAVQAAEKDHEAKMLAQETAKAEHEAATKECADREAALSNGKKAVEDFQPKLEAMTGQLAKAQEASAEFEAGPFAHFCAFQARVAALPVEEAPAEEAAAEAAPAEEAVEATA